MTKASTDTAAAMCMRADPPRVTRISRRLIVGIGLPEIMNTVQGSQFISLAWTDCFRYPALL